LGSSCRKAFGAASISCKRTTGIAVGGPATAAKGIPTHFECLCDGLYDANSIGSRIRSITAIGAAEAGVGIVAQSAGSTEGIGI
jgi:hypothetical protein